MSLSKVATQYSFPEPSQFSQMEVVRTKSENTVVLALKNNTLSQISRLNMLYPPPALFKEGTKAHTVVTKTCRSFNLIKIKLSTLKNILQDYLVHIQDFINVIKALEIRVIEVCTNDVQEYKPEEFKILLERIDKKSSKYSKKLSSDNDKVLNIFTQNEQETLDEIKNESDNVLPYYTQSEMVNLNSSEKKELFDQLTFELLNENNALKQKISQQIHEFKTMIITKEVESERLKVMKQELETLRKSLADKINFKEEELKLLEQSISNNRSDFQQNQQQYKAQIENKKILVLQEHQLESKALDDFKKKIQEQMNHMLMSLFGSTELKSNPIQNLLSFHLIFVIDESGSISPSHFEQIKQAFNQIVQMRRRHNKDKVSIIQFASIARQVYSGVPISTNFELKQQAGGTDFTSAFTLVKSAYSLTNPNQQAIICFLTDGQADTNQSIKILGDLYNQSVQSAMPLWTFAIGFTQCCDRRALEGIVKAGNGGSLSRQVNNKQIEMLYDCKDVSALIKAFETIGKICDDCLDSREALIETQKQRLEEFLEYIQQQKKASMDRVTQDLVALQEGCEKIRNLGANMNQDELNMIMQEISELKRVQDQLKLELLALDDRMSAYSYQIKKTEEDMIQLKDDLSKSGIEKKYQQLCDKKSVEEVELINQEENLRRVQENGFSGQNKEIIMFLRPLTRLIFDMPQDLQNLIAELLAKLKAIGLDVADINEDMQNIHNNKILKKMAGDTVLKILSSAGVISYNLSYDPIQHFPLLIDYYISQLKIDDVRINQFFKDTIHKVDEFIINDDPEEEKTANQTFREEKIVTFAQEKISFNPINPDKVLGDQIIKDLRKGTLEEQEILLSEFMQNEMDRGELDETREKAYAAKMAEIQKKQVQEKLKQEKNMLQQNKLKKEISELQQQYDELTVDKNQEKEFNKFEAQVFLCYRKIKESFTNSYDMNNYCFLKTKLQSQFMIVKDKKLKQLKYLKKFITQFNEATKSY